MMESADLTAMSRDPLEEPDVQTSKIMPEKSKLHYESAYKQFKDWCRKKKIDSLTENVLLAYLEEISRTRKPSSVWTIYSMLKTTLRIKDDVDINRYKRLTPFLKKKMRGFCSEKSKILTTEQIKQFIYEADNQKYLLMKIILIMGISGRCIRDELVRMTVDDIEDRGSVLVVRVPDSKAENQCRTFTIIDLDYIALYRMYASLRPAQTTNRRFFFKYHNGRCYNQVVGINKISSIPSMVARYFKLPNPKSYTAHCFRKKRVVGLNFGSCNNAGATTTTFIFTTGIKREKSVTPPPPPPPAVAETPTMTEESAEAKIEISEKILDFEISDSNIQLKERDMPSTSETGDSLPDSVRSFLTSTGINLTCYNCTINFNIIKK